MANVRRICFTIPALFSLGFTLFIVFVFQTEFVAEFYAKVSSLL
jgi:hypothetical protein